MKIILKNKTHYRDDHIRAFIKRAMKYERPDLCKAKAPAMRVTVVTYNRPGWRREHSQNGKLGSSGYAYCNSLTMTVRLPKVTDTSIIDKVDFAGVIAHELAHTRGMTHATMRGNSRYRRIGSYSDIYAWGNELPLDIKPVKVKPAKVVVINNKLLNAEKHLKQAMTREKRATTIRKKWQQKVRYYSTKAAACAPETT